MEVILRQAVEALGHPGDIVKVSAGYARNYLLPRGFAYEATAGNRKRIEQERQRLEQAEEAADGPGKDQRPKQQDRADPDRGERCAEDALRCIREPIDEGVAQAA